MTLGPISLVGAKLFQQRLQGGGEFPDHGLIVSSPTRRAARMVSIRFTTLNFGIIVTAKWKCLVKTCEDMAAVWHDHTLAITACRPGAETAITIRLFRWPGT